MTKTEQISLSAFADELIKDGVIDANEVKQIKSRIYEDGVIDREEADFLFELNDAVSGANNDSSWSTLFVEALTEHVLKDETSPGVLDDEESSYLIEKIKGDGVVDGNELALMVNIISNAKECASTFISFVLSSLKEAILEDGVIDSDEVKMIKTVIYGEGGGAGEGVDREEAEFLFALNDAVSGKNNSPAWKDLFVEAITKHVLDDEESPGEIDEDEAEWLIKNIEGDGVYDECEKALLVRIKSDAKIIHSKLHAVYEKLDL